MNGHIRERCAGHVERTQSFIRFSAERLRNTIRRGARHLDGGAAFQGCERSRDGLDRQAEIIGDVLPRHGQFDGVTGQATRSAVRTLAS
jgi:hypothetical protein